MKRGLRRLWINLKWQEKRGPSRSDQIKSFRAAVRALEKTFNVEVIHTIDDVAIRDLKEKDWTIYDWDGGYKI